MVLPDAARAALDRARGKRVVFLTGAGVSAESGIPTFRGAEGYWLVGSRNYHPMELARRTAFDAQPETVWAWYLYRRGVCRRAEPNAAHRALAALEDRLQDRFALVTQNVDGLHRRAGSTGMRTCEIHGNVEYMRCAKECSLERAAALIPMPAELAIDWAKGRDVTPGELALLVCPRCGARTRPHVLFFDEVYSEELFRAATAVEAAQRAELIVVAGTTLQTSLPWRIVQGAANRGTPLLGINVEASELDAIARGTGGCEIVGPAAQVIPEIAAALA